MISVLERKPAIDDLHNKYVLNFDSESFDSLILPTICAFINTDGGTIHFGYDGRNICGLKASNIVQNSIKSIITRAETLKDHKNCIDVSKDLIEGKEVVCIRVDKAERSIGFIPTDGKYFFRIEDKNILVSKDIAAYTEKRALFGFPRITDYYPRSGRSEFTKLKGKNKVEIRTIGDFRNNKSNQIYKYMDLQAALLSLSKGNMRLYEPSNWDDDYECRFYNAVYSPDNKDKTPFLYATCLASLPDNETAWVLYPHNQTGLASRCVQFEINLMEFRKQLVENAKNVMIYFGAVRYKNTYIINHLHESKINGHDNSYYHAYFDNFSLECYLNLLLMKRTLFEHEEEIRLFIIPKPGTDDSKNCKTRKIGEKKYEGNPKPLYTEIHIDWSRIIENVRIDKDSTECERSFLQKELDKLYRKRIRWLKSECISFDKKKEKKKFTLSPFNPYEDKSLTSGPITIVTN